MNNRRHFLTALALSIGAASTETILAFSPQESVVAALREVESLIGEYGIVRGIAHSAGEVRISVKIGSYSNLAKSFTSPSLGKIMAHGNILRFQYQNVPFVIDHVV